MSSTTDANIWRAYAESDLRAAETLLQSGNYPQCAFYCQQAIEKIIKAVIVARTGHRPTFTHNFWFLVKEADLAIPDDVMTQLIRIGTHYIASRYPSASGEVPVYDAANTRELYEQTHEVFQWFIARLPSSDTSTNI